MKKILFSLLLPVVVVAATSFRDKPTQTAPVALKWYTWEEAAALNKTAPKKILVDVYTNWCGWCKQMDKTTFVDPAVANYLAENFYAVKLNAEQKADIQYEKQTFKYVETGGGRGVHTLAYALLDGNMSYPTIVYLNEKHERIMISPGFKQPADLLKELKFAAEEQYRRTTWDQYKANN